MESESDRYLKKLLKLDEICKKDLSQFEEEAFNTCKEHLPAFDNVQEFKEYYDIEDHDER